MTIVCYQPLMAVLALGRMVPFISICHSSYNEFPSDYLSKLLFSLGYIQHHSLCEHHHNETGFVNYLWLFYQQPTSEWSSLSLTCQRNTICNLYCFQMTLKLHLPTHSLCFLDTIIPPNQHHALIPSSFHLFAIEIPHGIILFIPSTLTSCSRSI